MSHGPRADQRDLPGPLQPLPPEPRPPRHVRLSASGPSSATARWTSRSRSARLHVAAREGLDNLTFVVNCNLQRLDGPVRGNGKIIQELEGLFRGAGWNVIKVIWGREWDDAPRPRRRRRPRREDERAPSTASSRSTRSPAGPTSASTSSGRTRGSARSSSTVRRRPRPTSAAAATTTARSTPRTRRRPSTRGAPTVILAHTVKGWTLGAGRRGPQHHPPGEEALRGRAEDLPRPARAADPGRRSSRTRRTTTPGPTREEVEYLRERRRALGGFAPAGGSSGRPRCRRRPPAVDAEFAAGSDTPVSTTMASPGSCGTSSATRSSARGSCRSSPTRPGRSAWTRSSRRSASTPRHGQRYEPVDSDLVLVYREAIDGQVLEEGITEAGSMASLQAAGDRLRDATACR